MILVGVALQMDVGRSLIAAGTLCLCLIPIEATGDRASEPRRGAQVGFATYYARHFEGRITASGRRFDNDAMVAAHPTHPFGTILRVTNLSNQRSVRVRVVDRGPARGPRAEGVVIDLSRAAAEELGFIRAGRTRVRVEVIRRPAA